MAGIAEKFRFVFRVFCFPPRPLLVVRLISTESSVAAGLQTRRRAAREIADVSGEGMPIQGTDYVPNRLQQTRTVALPITHDHALRSGELPPHHRDPFDRLLIAQAQIERLPFLTADRHLAAYDVEVIWA